MDTLFNTCISILGDKIEQIENTEIRSKCISTLAAKEYQILSDFYQDLKKITLNYPSKLGISCNKDIEILEDLEIRVAKNWPTLIKFDKNEYMIGLSLPEKGSITVHWGGLSVVTFNDNYYKVCKVLGRALPMSFVFTGEIILTSTGSYDIKIKRFRSTHLPFQIYTHYTIVAENTYEHVSGRHLDCRPMLIYSPNPIKKIKIFMDGKRVSVSSSTLKYGCKEKDWYYLPMFNTDIYPDFEAKQAQYSIHGQGPFTIYSLNPYIHFN